ncbi:unnamed protein product, partial [Didymodactylos carnosus]
MQANELSRVLRHVRCIFRTCNGGLCAASSGSSSEGSTASTPAQSSSDPFDSDEVSGEATFYYMNDDITACGTKHNDSEMVGALNAAQFDPRSPH